MLLILNLYFSVRIFCRVTAWGYNTCQKYWNWGASYFAILNRGKSHPRNSFLLNSIVKFFQKYKNILLPFLLQIQRQKLKKLRCSNSRSNSDYCNKNKKIKKYQFWRGKKKKLPNKFSTPFWSLSVARCSRVWYIAPIARVNPEQLGKLRAPNFCVSKIDQLKWVFGFFYSIPTKLSCFFLVFFKREGDNESHKHHSNHNNKHNDYTLNSSS